MRKENNKKTANNKAEQKDKEKLAREERERREILAKISHGNGKQLELDGDGVKTAKEARVFALGSVVDNPAAKYDTYYKGLNKLLRKHLPKGKENKQGRDYIYEEKNTFLTRGHRKDKNGIRHADGRMAYLSDVKTALKVSIDWVVRNGTPIELFDAFRELNIKKGYGAPKG